MTRTRHRPGPADRRRDKAEARRLGAVVAEAVRTQRTPAAVIPQRLRAELAEPVAEQWPAVGPREAAIRAGLIVPRDANDDPEDAA
jgi:hypothetical protein